MMHRAVEPDIAAVAVGEERRRELRMIERAREDYALVLGAARDAESIERLRPAAARRLDRAVEIPRRNFLRQRIARALHIDRRKPRLDQNRRATGIVEEESNLELVALDRRRAVGRGLAVVAENLNPRSEQRRAG